MSIARRPHRSCVRSCVRCTGHVVWPAARVFVRVSPLWRWKRLLWCWRKGWATEWGGVRKHSTRAPIRCLNPTIELWRVQMTGVKAIQYLEVLRSPFRACRKQKVSTCKVKFGCHWENTFLRTDRSFTNLVIYIVTPTTRGKQLVVPSRSAPRHHVIEKCYR